MKVFIFNREKYIKERLDFHKEYSEKVSKLTDEEKERMIKRTTWINLKAYFKWASKPSEEFEKELRGVKWAKELDGVAIDNWVNPFGNHLEYYNRYIDEKWCDVVEDEDYQLDYRKVTNIYTIHELLKEKSNDKELFKTKELMNTLSKFGEVTKNEEYNRIDLIFLSIIHVLHICWLLFYNLTHNLRPLLYHTIFHLCSDYNIQGDYQND